MKGMRGNGVGMVNMSDEKRSGRPCLVKDDLKENVNIQNSEKQTRYNVRITRTFVWPDRIYGVTKGKRRCAGLSEQLGH